MKKTNEQNRRYAGNAFSQGLTLSKSVGDILYLSSAARAEDGTITTTTKVIVSEPDHHVSWIKRMVRKIYPKNVSGGYKSAVTKTLMKNDGKFHGEVQLEAADKWHSLFAFVPMLLIIMFLPMLTLLFPIPYMTIIQLVESFFAVVFITVLFAGLLFMLAKDEVSKNHGAEHMIIGALRAGENLTHEKIRKYRRVDPACGIAIYFSTLFLAAVLNFVVKYQLGLDGSFQRVIVRLLSVLLMFFLLLLFGRLVNSKNIVLKIITNIVLLMAC